MGVLPPRMILLGLRNIDLAMVYHNLIKLNKRYITFQEWIRADSGYAAKTALYCLLAEEPQSC